MWAIVDTSGWGVAECHRGFDIVRKAPSRLRGFFAPLTAFLLVALSLVFVGVATPANAASECGSAAGWTKIDDDHGSASGPWGSLSYDGRDNNPGDRTTITYSVNDGWTIELCIKAGTAEDYSGPIEGAASGSFSTGDKFGISHIGYQVDVTLPNDPTYQDPCGVDNATWNVPDDTATITWTVVGGELIATAKAGYTFTDGTKVKNYGAAPDSGELCGPEEIEVPAEPSVTDPCGPGNATWDVPTDDETFEWDVVDGDLIVTIVAENTVFEGTDDTTYNFGEAVETNLEECEVDAEELEVPAEPEVSDPCGAGNAEWIVPDDDETFDWELVDGELIVSILAENTVFEGTDDTTYNFGEAVETNLEECEVLGEQLEIPAQPEVKDPCGADNARWIVPADTDKLDWTLDDGVLSVEITAADTVFEGTEDTTYSFGEAVETNTDACEVKGDQDNDDLTVEVKGEQATVPTAVDAGLPGLVENRQQDTTRNPLWLLAIGGGLGLMGIAGSRRRRTATR
jgi:hypothetical protein